LDNPDLLCKVAIFSSSPPFLFSPVHYLSTSFLSLSLFISILLSPLLPPDFLSYPLCSHLFLSPFCH
jgi:hypothetical protein